MTALIGAAVGRLRFDHAPMALEQQAEVESASGVAELIGPAISRLGLGQRPLLFEQSAEVRGGGATVTFDQCDHRPHPLQPRPHGPRVDGRG